MGFNIHRSISRNEEIILADGRFLCGEVAAVAVRVNVCTISGVITNESVPGGVHRRDP